MMEKTEILLVIFLPAIIHQIIGNIIEPKIFGDAFGLHPITIILSLIFWGMIWGPVGMLMAAPMTAIMRIILARFETTHPAAELLAGRLTSTQPRDGEATQVIAETP